MVPVTVPQILNYNTAEIHLMDSFYYIGACPPGFPVNLYKLNSYIKSFSA